MESLPKQFVAAMRTLFDIMDDKRTGYVNLTDIENRWRDDRTKGLPQGVVESLQKVASSNGLLTFDRFCTGLKICLMRNEVGQVSHKINLNNEIDKTVTASNINNQKNRPPSAPIIDIDGAHSGEHNWSDMKVSEIIHQHRTTSMPLLLGRNDIRSQDIHHSALLNAPKARIDCVYNSGPPKPPRLEKKPDRKDVTISNLKSEESFDLNQTEEINNILASIESRNRGNGDGRCNSEFSQTQIAVRRAPRRREPRRHTLHNGVDYNLIKRMKQIELEKDILVQGLTSVDEAREWYLRQLSEVQDRMRYLGRVGVYVEPWTEAQQERLELLRARVFELNRQLGALVIGWRRGPLSLHMNLALPTTPFSCNSLQESNQTLMTQSRMLIEEVNKKNERISILEREKSALIRELLLQRNRTKNVN